MSGVIFDMDGVLVDSEPVHIESDIETLQHYGITAAPQDLEGFTGVQDRAMYRQLSARYGIQEPVEAITAHKSRLLVEKLRGHTLQMPGLFDMLRSVEVLTSLRALASSSPRAVIDVVLSELGLEKWFSVTVGGDEILRSKPDPDIFLEAASGLGLNPRECVVLEDSMHGVSAAKAAGMYVVGFASAGGGSQDLRIADTVISSLVEFPALLERFVESG